MKKFLAYLLVSAAFLGASSAFYLLKLKQLYTKKQVKRMLMRGIPEEQLVLLSFSEEEMRNELRWEHNKEFEYRGMMYDIVRREKQGENTVFYCWPDHRESRLNRQLDAIAHRMNHQSNERNSRRLAFSDILFKVVLPGSPEIKGEEGKMNKDNIVHIYRLISSYIDGKDLPPEYYFSFMV